ncbi:MAG TPA: hypothetical protein VMQ10_07945 [Spirochaetia bacterium]|nr:hypothetical protein [Spirochaetia bacterium]
MRYRIRTSDDHRLVLAFSMPERPVVIVILALLSLVCLVVGLAYVLSPEAPGDSLRALSFTAFGLFCLSAIFLFANSYARAFPMQMVFDNGAGQLELRGRSGARIGSVPYAGISGFSVIRAVDNRVVRHSAGLELARGGRWELYASQQRGPVDVFQRAVSAAVHLKAAGAGASAGTTPAPADALATGNGPSRLVVDRAGDGTLRLSWRRAAHPGQLILSLVVLLLFVGALAGTRPFAQGLGAYLVAVIFGAFFLVVALVGILRTMGDRLEILLRRGALEYRHRSALTRPRGFTRPLSQVAAVDFSMSFSRITTGIVVLQPQEVEQFVRYRQGTFGLSEVPGLARFLRGLARIDVSALELEQRLALAELIRETVSRERPATG